MNTRNIYQMLEKLDTKIDRLDAKLDKQSNRITAVEVKIENHAGTINWALSGVIALGGAFITYLLNLVFGKH